MTRTLWKLGAILLIGLLAGSALANYLLERSLPASASFDIEYKQLVIRAYTLALPAVGAGSIVAALAVAVLDWKDRISAWSSVGASACLLVGLGITLGIHFPINHQVVIWSPAAPPADLRVLLDQWREANTARTITAIAAFMLILVPVARGLAVKPDASVSRNERVA